MLWIGYGIIVVFAILTLAFMTTMKNKQTSLFQKMYRAIAIGVAMVFAARFLLGKNEVMLISGLETAAQPLSALWGLIMLWLSILCVLVFVLNAFYNIKTIKQVLTFVVLPISVLNAGLFFNTLPAMIGTSGAFDARSLLLALEIGLILGGSLALTLQYKVRMTTKKEVLAFATALFGMLLATLPSYFFYVIFGAGPDIEIIDVSVGHRLVLYFSIFLAFAIYFSMHKKDEQTKHFTLLFFSLATMIGFSIRFPFSTWSNPANWPLHLCNTAMYIIPLCLIFKWNKLFYFTYFINVLGAALAMLMPNYTIHGVFSPSLWEFWINHIPATILPILIVALKIYPRPTWKQFRYAMVGFAMYFGFVLICNSWFSNYGSVDFFFINSDFIASKLGKWAENIFALSTSFQIGDLTFVFYPLYQALFYVVYCLLGLGTWFVFENGFILAERTSELFQRRKAIRMDELALKSELGGRKKTLPINPKGANMLRIVDFSKRYGNSKVFAVKNANLEVHAGEIFGFLGPNGAGKSTIIKSMVGIQPITSGKMEICGFDVEKQSVEAKMNTGFVPDHYALYEKLTGREYINYIADLYRVSKADRDMRIANFLKVFELEQAFDNQIKTYSHGMKQKIAIIAALIHNPKVWILDEPLTGLDPNSIFQVKEIMKQHARAGNIVFFSSHIIDVVERICDRIAIIKKGNILCTQVIADLEKDNIHLEDFYLSTIGETLGGDHAKD